MDLFASLFVGQKHKDHICHRKKVHYYINLASLVATCCHSQPCFLAKGWIMSGWHNAEGGLKDMGLLNKCNVSHLASRAGPTIL